MFPRLPRLVRPPSAASTRSMPCRARTFWTCDWPRPRTWPPLLVRRWSGSSGSPRSRACSVTTRATQSGPLPLKRCKDANSASLALRECPASPAQPPVRLGARPLPPKAASAARQRQVLTGERGPGHVGVSRQRGGREVAHVCDRKVVTTPVPRVALRLPSVDVVGEEAAPPRPEARLGHPAAREEIVEGGEQAATVRSRSPLASGSGSPRATRG